jgi:hypothetical protein
MRTTVPVASRGRPKLASDSMVTASLPLLDEVSGS